MFFHSCCRSCGSVWGMHSFGVHAHPAPSVDVLLGFNPVLMSIHCGTAEPPNTCNNVVRHRHAEWRDAVGSRLCGWCHQCTHQMHTMDSYPNAHEPSYHHDGILPKCTRAVLSPRWIPTQMHTSRPITTMESYTNAHEPSYHHDGFLPKCIRAVLSSRWIPTQMHTSRPITTMESYPNAHEPSYHHDGFLPKCTRAVLSPRWNPTEMHTSRPITTMDSYPNA